MQRFLLHLYSLGTKKFEQLPLWYRWLWCMSSYFSIRLCSTGRHLSVITPLFAIYVAWGAKCHDRQRTENGIRLWAVPRHWTLLYDQGDCFHRHHWEWMVFHSVYERLTFPQQGG